MTRIVALLGALILLLPRLVSGATGTIMPAPFLTVLDASGNPISGAKICVFQAGTTVFETTYTDVALTVPNTNPIIADSAGRFTAFLAHGHSYKFVYQSAAGSAGFCDGVTFKTVDNISTVPGDPDGIDLTGVAGETLAAGSAAYLSDGSGGKTAGQWYLASSANSYSSTTPTVGMVPSFLTATASGVIRIAGLVTGLTGLTPGAIYYISTAGAVTTSAPSNSRVIGQADASTTGMVVAIAPPPVINWSSVTFSAGNFVAVGGGSWTVASGDQSTFKYIKVGKTLTVSLFLVTTTVAGTVTSVTVPIPGSYVSANASGGDCKIYDNTATAFESGHWVVGPGGTTITFVRAATAAFSASTDLTSIRATMIFEVQ